MEKPGQARKQQYWAGCPWGFPGTAGFQARLHLAEALVPRAAQGATGILPVGISNANHGQDARATLVLRAGQARHHGAVGSEGHPCRSGRRRRRGARVRQSIHHSKLSIQNWDAGWPRRATEKGKAPDAGPALSANQHNQGSQEWRRRRSRAPESSRGRPRVAAGSGTTVMVTKPKAPDWSAEKLPPPVSSL